MNWASRATKRLARDVNLVPGTVSDGDVVVASISLGFPEAVEGQMPIAVTLIGDERSFRALQVALDKAITHALRERAKQIGPELATPAKKLYVAGNSESH